MTRKKTNAVQTACERAGTQRSLAATLGVSEQVVCVWAKRGWVPLARAQEIEALFGVPRKSLINPRLLDLVSAEIAL